MESTTDSEAKKTIDPNARVLNWNFSDLDEKFLERAYNPDGKFEMRPSETMLSRFIDALNTKNADGKLPDNVSSAKIFEVNRYGCYRIRKIGSAGELREAVSKSERGFHRISKLIEAGVRLNPVESLGDDEIKKLKEAVPTIFGSGSFDVAAGDPASEDPNALTGDTFQEYLPMLGGPFSKQLYLYDYLDMHRKCFEAWNHNPLAHQVIKITTFFVLGRGVSWKACHPECQQAFTDWADKIDLQRRLEEWCDMLSRDGELMIQKFRHFLTGRLFLRWIDPSTIWEIITDLEDIERVFYFHQQFPTQYQILYGTGSQLSPYRPQDYLTTKYVINQIPSTEMLHYKVNCSPNEKRGRSDLFPVLGWIKRYKDFWTARVLRAIIQSTFAWKNKLKGSDTDVAAFINSFGTTQPNFGSVWVENEASDLQPMTVDLKGSDSLADAEGILNMIAVGTGVPKEYLGYGTEATRATALVASEPGAKKFQARQQLLKRVLRDIAQEFFRIEIERGRLPSIVKDEKGNDVPHTPKIDFHFPEIAIEDRSAKLRDISLVQASGYVSRETAAMLSAKELDIEDFKWEDEKEKMKAEEIEDATRLYDRPTPELSGTPPEKKPPLGLPSAEKKSAKDHDRGAE